MTASSEQVRILPAGAEALIPEDAGRVCWAALFRDLTHYREALVHRALTAGVVPAPRIAQLTGLDPQDIGRLVQS
ncbi:DUF6003 family protein [Streptomyces sp. AC550_RSS872]|uniref:DUF6003 family protein n=1 Tax=Streptomyces sp. AC550_RSS872 TaxID=2823689 RepID=UPI0027E42C1A|nr:DUF6003 family protein [Streptomyces sp. AC550_RSS872]